MTRWEPGATDSHRGGADLGEDVPDRSSRHIGKDPRGGPDHQVRAAAACFMRLFAAQTTGCHVLTSSLREPSGSGEPDGRLCNLGEGGSLRIDRPHDGPVHLVHLGTRVSVLSDVKVRLRQPRAARMHLRSHESPWDQSRVGASRASHHLRWRARSRSSARGTPRRLRPCSPRAASMTASCWVARLRSSLVRERQ